jgi:ABC-type phosphate/phosphonate transport system substrate-binding protein
VVFESEPLPAFVACAIDDRLDDDDEAALFAALLELDDEQGGADVLEQIRLVRFESLSDVQIDELESVRERTANRE